MYLNNEIGNLLPLETVCNLCCTYNALFHSDTVQAIGHYNIDLQQIAIDFIAASAHKFHGPKGVGFAYFKKGFGFNQCYMEEIRKKELDLVQRMCIAYWGMEKALAIAVDNIASDTEHLTNLKSYFISELRSNFTDVGFNGNSSDLSKSSYTILSTRFSNANDMLLFTLDLNGIAVSGGSACQSGE